MKAMMMGFAAMIVISVGAYFGLHELGYSTDARSPGDTVRLD
ncbi:hypothetical protein [Ruegeria spongiae]|nr:hypothetical protein [Ruegeria spongiae]